VDPETGRLVGAVAASSPAGQSDTRRTHRRGAADQRFGWDSLTPAELRVAEAMGGGPDQRPSRSASVRVPLHRRLPPAPDLPQARHQLPGPTRRLRQAALTARRGAPLLRDERQDQHLDLAPWLHPRDDVIAAARPLGQRARPGRTRSSCSLGLHASVHSSTHPTCAIGPQPAQATAWFHPSPLPSRPASSRPESAASTTRSRGAAGHHGLDREHRTRSCSLPPALASRPATRGDDPTTS